MTATQLSSPTSDHLKSLYAHLAPALRGHSSRSQQQEEEKKKSKAKSKSKRASSSQRKPSSAVRAQRHVQLLLDKIAEQNAAAEASAATSGGGQLQNPNSPKKGKKADANDQHSTMSGETLLEFQQQFSSSGRAGRRNAMADLGLEGLDPGAHKLAEQFEQLGHHEGQAPAGALGGAGPSSSKGEQGVLINRVYI